MIRYSKVIQPNYHDPVWLSEAKVHLNIDGNELDSLITQKIVTASAMCERYTGLSFMLQTRRITLDRFPCRDIELPYGPVTEVTVFTYSDPDDAEVDFTNYVLDVQSGIARVSSVESWPYTNMANNNIIIEYTAGVEDAVDVFPEAREAIFKLVARMLENRGDTDAGGLFTQEIYDLLDLIKVYWDAG